MTSNYNWGYHTGMLVVWLHVCAQIGGEVLVEMFRRSNLERSISPSGLIPNSPGVGDIRFLVCEDLEWLFLFLLFPSACQTRSSLARSSQLTSNYHDHDISF